ncbi:uncharacterized protein PRCAT00003931001 [Priceomyces carsonii]|uniref:uncharacterized protein n=1 Tax=Priceomyces carsonii TaxID=28549 RepID=UPI002ED96DBA|nr:unnamed protein product [Priceomyces carsonii]
MTVEEQESYVFQSKVAHRQLSVIKGNGIKITFKDPKTGKCTEALDAMTGAAVGALGWGDSEVVNFINEAAMATTYSYPGSMNNEFSEKLAKFYIDNSPKGAFASALWVTSGSEANENAMKIIRQYHLEKKNFKKTKFISRNTSYHGFTLGALSIGNSARSKMFQEILLPTSQCLKVEPCYPYRNKKKGESLEQYGDRLVDEMEELILKEDPDTIGGVIVETLPGSSLGTVPPPANYLKGIRKLCNKYDIVFMVDEVMCGTGRINPNGKLNCWENFLTPEESPDLQSVGKTLGSGYVTIAGVLISPKVKRAFVEGSGSIIGAQTYSSHAFNCYVALKIQERIKELKLTENIFNVGNYMGEKLKDALADSKIAGDVRGLGGFWSVELVKDRDTKESFPVGLDIAHRLQDICLSNGITVMGTQGCNAGVGDIIMLAPAFVITKVDADNIVSIVAKSVKELEGEL